MKTHTVLEGQSIYDVSIIYCGNTEGVLAIVKENNLPTYQLTAGQVLNIPEFENKSKKVVEYFQQKNIAVATGFQEQKAEDTTVIGTGYWNDSGTWDDTQVWQDQKYNY